VYKFSSALTGQCLKSVADVVFILDASGSVDDAEWALLKNFVVDVIRDLDIGENFTRVSVITFSSVPIRQIRLDDYFNATELVSAVLRIPNTIG